MKNVNFPFDGLPDINELNNLFQNMLESSGNLVNYMMKIHGDKKLMPDRYSGWTFELVIEDEERIPGLDICQSKGKWNDRCFDC